MRGRSQEIVHVFYPLFVALFGLSILLKMSTRSVVFNLINCIIGVSVLAMPFCFQECGIMLCGVAIVSSSWLTKKSCELLLKAGQVARRRNYEGLALSTYGAPGKLAVETSIIGLLIGTLIAFNVIIGDLVPSIFHNLSGVEVSWTVRAVLMTVLAFGVGLPLSMMRNLHSLSSFSALSLLFYMGFVLQIFLTALPKIMEGSWIYELNYWRPEKLLQYLPIFALAFACQTQLFALYDTLPEPSVKKMEGVVSTGINIVGSVYFLVGLFGYICFHNAGVKGDMLNNYGNTFISYIIKLGFVMSVVVSFPLMVYPLRASLHSLIFQQSHNSESLPGGAGFIPHERFTYLTLAIISGTLTLGILFPQIEFVLALTGATMGTLIAFVFPSSMFLHVVTEKSQIRLVAKLVLVLGLVCFVAGTYTVLMTQESAEHGHHVDIHPPGIDPIKPMAIRDSIQKHIAVRDAVQEDNTTNIHVKDGPVDMDVAKIGLQGGNAVKEDVANDAKPGEVKPVEVKPIDAAANEGLNLKAVEPAQPDEDEGKRQEPPVPHAPQDKPAENAPDKQHGNEEHLNEKRQLMSNGEEDKLPKPPLKENNVDDAVAARSIADSNQVKVSKQEIDAELKNLQQPDKVPRGASVRQAAEKDTVYVDPALNEAKPQQDTPEKSLVKRDVHDLANGDYKLEESDKANRTAREHIGVSKTSENQTHPVEKDVSKRKQLSDSSQHSRDGRTSLESNNKTAAMEDRHEVENSIKIRDLKSNRKPKVKHIVASKSFRTFLSKQNSRRSRRSNLQGESR